MGYALTEDPRPGAFDVATAQALGVPSGPDFGVLQRGGEVVVADGRVVRPDDVLGAPRDGRTVVISGDTEPCAATLAAARGASVLVHEATFLDEDRDRARETRHSTALEAATLAKEADVGLLVLTHLSSRFAPRDLRAEAESVFDRVDRGPRLRSGRDPVPRARCARRALRAERRAASGGLRRCVGRTCYVARG